MGAALTLAALAGDMVIEANFHPHSELEVDRLRGLDDRVVEAHCACLAEVAVARYNARSRNEVHWLKTATLSRSRFWHPGPLRSVTSTLIASFTVLTATVTVSPGAPEARPAGREPSLEIVQR